MAKYPMLIGMPSAVAAVEQICTNSIPYENTKVTPLLLELEAGNGQTTLAKYTARKIIERKVRQVVGLTTYLEFAVSPNKSQMQIMFGDIEAAAKGVNQFESVILFEISQLCDCVNEAQTDYFLQRLQEIAKHAVVLLCISPSKVKAAEKAEKLKRKLQQTLKDIKMVSVEPYTDRELAQMVLAKLDDYGIDILEEAVFADRLTQILGQCDLTYAKETELFAEKLAKQAVIDRFSAVLDLDGLNRAIHEIDKKVVA